MYLGVRAVLTKNFARIHRTNLVNFGIIPLTFDNADDYEKISQGDKLQLSDIKSTVKGDGKFTLKNLTNGTEIPVSTDLSDRQKDIMLKGGLLPFVRSKAMNS